MDIILMLTIRHLKQNKKRTLSAAAGICAASVLLTLSAVFITSFLHRLESDDFMTEDIAPLLSAAAVMAAVILAVLVIFLYNMLSISARDKIRYLGMLGSVGATPFQRGKTALLEAVILGILGVPAGICIGSLLSFVVFPFPVIMSWKSLLIIFLSECLTILLTGLLQAVQSGRGTVIELIQNKTDKRNYKKPAVLPGWIMSKFGAESSFAVKNMVFFKRRYLFVGISFILSMLLFLDGYIYMNYLDGNYEVHDRRPKKLAEVTLTEETGKRISQWDEFIADVAALPQVKECTWQESTKFGGMLLDSEHIRPDLKKFTAYELGVSYTNPTDIYDAQNNKKNGYYMNMEITALDDESFQAYLKQCGVSGDYETSGNAVPVLIEDYSLVKVNGFLKYRSILNLKENSILSVISDVNQGLRVDCDKVSKFQKHDFYVLGVTDKVPPNYDFFSGQLKDTNTIHLYTTASGLKHLNPKETTRSLSVRTKSKAAELPDNILYPATIQTVNKTSRQLKLSTSFLSMLMDEKMEKNLKIHSRADGELQQEIRKIGEKYGLSDGVDAENGKIDIQELEISEMDYFSSSYSAAVLGALSDPFPLLRHLFVYGLLIFATIISIFQMIKMISASTQMRRREFAVFMSLGMSRRQIGKMLCIENLICNTVSFFAGMALSVIIAIGMFLTWNKEQAVEIVFPYHLLILEGAVFIILMGVSIYTAMKSIKNIKLVDVIKDETI